MSCWISYGREEKDIVPPSAEARGREKGEAGTQAAGPQLSGGIMIEGYIFKLRGLTFMNDNVHMQHSEGGIICK